jgi:predicted phosphoribosyltransferase
MIHNDTELEATQERIVRFEKILFQLRVTAQPEEFAAVSSGYRRELEKMHAEVLAYLSHHASEVLQEAA